VHAPNPTMLADGSPTAPDRRAQRNIMIAMITALVAVLAAMSGLNVAQEQMAIDLGASQGDVLWIINAYTVALAALLLPVGAIGDRFGRKTVLLAGLAVFGIATVGSLMATTTMLMILARVAAGAGAAMIMPVTLSIITSSFPPEDKAKAIGIWAGFAGGGSMIAMFVSAFMVDVLTWRWVFVLPLVLISVSAVMTVLHAPNSKEASVHRFDTVGSVLSALAIGGLVLGIHEGPEKGWTAPLTILALCIGIVSVALFVVWERRQAEPLLDISAFRDRGLAAGTVTLLIVFAVMFGVFLVLFPYFQAVLGWTALRSAAALLPMMLVMMPMSTIAPKIANHVGRRNTMSSGVALFAFGLALMALRASVEGGYLSVLPGLIVVGLGMGLTMTPATESITETLPAEKQGVASALNDASRELGGAIGIALLGSVLTAGYRSAITPALAGLPVELAHPASEGIGTALAVAADAGDHGPAIIDAAKHAFVTGWTHSMWLGVGMAGVALVYLLVRGPVRRTAAPHDQPADLVNVG
jgi:EmrB/QacA subfamily drug resistance transporter